jgi:ABC-type oligopeptide transport system substrate-binding subunit
MEVSFMKTTQLTLAVLLATGFAAAPFAAEAKKMKHQSSTSSSQTTTGANMKSGMRTNPAAANPSSEGNVGPGTNQAGSLSTPAR